MSDQGSEAKAWAAVTEMLGDGSKELGSHWSFNILNDPKRLAFVLSRYKFAAKMTSPGGSVLELGCSEGIGAPVLAEHASSYLGLDLDEPAISAARANFGREGVEFRAMDFIGAELGSFDAVVSLDVIEHIYEEHEDRFLDTVAANVGEDGICVVGTPNVAAEQHASPMSRAGHVNLYDADRLTAALRRIFHVVLPFGINDETVHTGFAPMSHYLIAVGCYRR